MLTVSGIELGMRYYHDQMRMLADEDKKALQEQDEIIATAIDHLNHKRIGCAHKVLSEYLKPSQSED